MRWTNDLAMAFAKAGRLDSTEKLVLRMLQTAKANPGLLPSDEEANLRKNLQWLQEKRKEGKTQRSRDSRRLHGCCKSLGRLLLSRLLLGWRRGARSRAQAHTYP